MKTSIVNTISHKHIIFYDGDCGFCNQWVQWILKHDTKDDFLFASLQSEFGQTFLKERGLENKDFNTIYLWKPNSFYLIKSQAVTKIVKILGKQYSLLAHLNVFPSFLGDKIYDAIAKKRHSLAPQQCVIPTEKDRKKFLS